MYCIGKQSSEQTSAKRDPFIDLCNLGSNSANQAPPTVPQVGPTGAWNSGENSASASRLSSPIHRPAATPSPSHQPDYRFEIKLSSIVYIFVDLSL